MASLWENLKPELFHAQHTVPTTLEQMFDLSRGTLVSRDELQGHLKTVEEEVASGVEDGKTLEVNLCDANLNP